MLNCMPADFSQAILTYVLPPLGALLSATALWVASRAQGTSRDARSISLGHADRSHTLPDNYKRRSSDGSTVPRPRS
jgi:hypothetical protein